MSVILPFLALLLAAGFAAYHRLRLAVWAAITASLLVAGWLLGANATASVVAAIIVALVTVPLVLPQLRKPFITTPLLDFYTKLLPLLSTATVTGMSLTSNS